mgnify:FL=1
MRYEKKIRILITLLTLVRKCEKKIILEPINKIFAIDYLHISVPRAIELSELSRGYNKVGSLYFVVVWENLHEFGRRRVHFTSFYLGK